MKRSAAPTEETFLADVKDHRLTIIRDDGVYRHIRLARPGTVCMHFDLIAWPGYLAYVGDMGAFTFTRLYDMFEFFRDSRDGNRGHIDLRYWAQKLVATDKGSGHEAFSVELFEDVINGYRLEWIRDAYRSGRLTKAERRELWEAVEEDVLRAASSGEHEAFQAAGEFSHRFGELTYTLDDFWDHDFRDYTYGFRWACFAIAWGIRQYDQATELPAMAEKDPAQP